MSKYLTELGMLIVGAFVGGLTGLYFKNKESLESVRYTALEAHNTELTKKVAVLADQYHSLDKRVEILNAKQDLIHEQLKTTNVLLSHLINRKSAGVEENMGRPIDS